MLSMFEEEELSFTTLYGDSSYESGIDLAEKAISQNPLPDIILCTNNYIAMACLQVARHKGLDIPDTIAIMTFDNYPFSMLVSKRSLPILLIRDSILLSKTRPFKLRQTKLSYLIQYNHKRKTRRTTRCLLSISINPISRMKS